MKILLLDCGRHGKSGAIPHLGFGYVAAVLEAAGHDVHYVDITAPSGGPDRASILRGFPMICLSASTFTFLEALERAKRVKKESPDSLVVLGGPHTSLEPKKILENPQIDIVVIGEGEETIVELAGAIEKKGGFDGDMVETIKGIACQQDGTIRCAPRRPWIEDLDRIPFPSFHHFPMHLYHHYPLITARGCPYDCVFCSSKVIWGRKWRERSPENLIREIKHAIRRYDWQDKYFAILDDTFNLNVDRAEAICDAIVEAELRIRWGSAGVRADRVTLSLAQKMRRAGCELVGLGIESANRQVLKNIKKGESLDEITKAVHAFQQAGIRVGGYFMIGNPGDTLETVRETIRYAKEAGLSHVDFSLAIPYPGTQLWELIESRGRFLMKDYYRFHNFRKMPIFETPEFSAEARRSAYRKARLFTIRLRTLQALKHGIRSLLEACLKAPLSVPQKMVRAIRRLTTELKN